MSLNPDDVKENPNLFPEEKETSIWFAKDQEHATIHTDEAALTRRLLNHPEATVDEQGIEVGDDGEIYSFYGTIPVGCLKVLSSSRETKGHPRVIGTSYRSEEQQGK